MVDGSNKRSNVRALAEHPIACSYWAQPGELLAGPHPGLGPRSSGAPRPSAVVDVSIKRSNVRALLEAGIRTVIDLTTPGEHPSIRVSFEKLCPDEEAWAWMNHPILDGGVPSRAGMQLVLDAIDRSRDRGRPVYVHCMGGLGRTGLVVACWWIRHGVHEGDAVFDALMHRREGQPNQASISPETPMQFRLVRSWLRGS